MYLLVQIEGAEVPERYVYEPVYGYGDFQSSLLLTQSFYLPLEETLRHIGELKEYHKISSVDTNSLDFFDACHNTENFLHEGDVKQYYYCNHGKTDMISNPIIFLGFRYIISSDRLSDQRTNRRIKTHRNLPKDP